MAQRVLGGKCEGGAPGSPPSSSRYRPAFHAWLATDPAHNPNSPPGPAYMPQYVIPQEAAAASYERAADATFASLVGVGLLLLVFSVIQLLGLPGPP